MVFVKMYFRFHLKIKIKKTISLWSAINFEGNFKVIGYGQIEETQK